MLDWIVVIATRVVVGRRCVQFHGVPHAIVETHRDQNLFGRRVAIRASLGVVDAAVGFFQHV